MDKERRVTNIIRKFFSDLQDEITIEQETEDYIEELILNELENANN